MTIHALFLIVIMGSILVFQFISSFISRFKARQNIKSELQVIFSWFWDGSPEDELYAWYKVRSVLKQREGEAHERKMAEVDRKISNVQKSSLLGEYAVNQDGRLVHTEKDAQATEM